MEGKHSVDETQKNTENVDGSCGQWGYFHVQQAHVSGEECVSAETVAVLISVRHWNVQVSP